MVASSSTSSWMSVAVWIISTAAAKRTCSGAKAAAGQPAQQHQGRPQPLAAEAKAVLYQVVDEGVLASQYLPEDFFDLVKPHLDGCIQCRQDLGCLDPVLGRLFHEHFPAGNLAPWLEG